MVEAVDKYFELLTRFPFEFKKHPGSKPIRCRVKTFGKTINQPQGLTVLLK
jgi:hypothetical protein